MASGKGHAFEWLEGPKQHPCHLLRSLKNGSSFLGNNLRQGFLRINAQPQTQ
jgi:hypothetical protein